MEETKPNVNVEEVKEVTKEEVATKPKRTKKETTKEEPKKERTWKEVFLDNYNGTSDEAKMLEPHLKTSYKGDIYIPWAVMERLTYMCDEHADFEVLENNNGGCVFTDICRNEQLNEQDGKTVSHTEAFMFAHFVKVELTFMGRTFIENYPIQDQDYSAARIYNQNLVNRAIQRAKAKVASRATGLGLKLYEGMDLQFETKPEDKKPELPVVETKKETKKPVEKVVEKPVEKQVEVPVAAAEKIKEENSVVEETKNVETISVNPAVTELIAILRNSDQEKVTTTLQRVNVSIVKKYNFALSLEDTDEELSNKISQFPNVEQFKKTIENLLK